MDGVKAFDFSVSLSPAEVAEKLKDGLNGRIVKAELLDEYQRVLPDGKEVRMLIFQKYSFLADDRPILTVVLDTLEGKTKVHLCGTSGVGGALGIDIVEAGVRFAEKARDVLKEYRLEDGL